jgi:hypothetical protein
MLQLFVIVALLFVVMVCRLFVTLIALLLLFVLVDPGSGADAGKAGHFPKVRFHTRNNRSTNFRALDLLTTHELNARPLATEKMFVEVGPLGQGLLPNDESHRD